ncbi:hypothetical protein GF340_05840 [Candidatus Peregrinibacteria bacterium]|nr:hypothetical protein [Candidatus Peregrinibacteria bacterium]
MPKILGKSVAGLGVIFLAILGIYLFFGSQINYYLYERDLFQIENEFESKGSLTIGYLFEPVSFEPTRFNPVNRSYLVNMYEGLIKLDHDLQIKPGLAIAWGMKDDKTWEFILRPNVFFHDGSTLDAEDVIASIERARLYKDSQLIDFLSTIEDVTRISEDRIQITTVNPDPLLLQKLSITNIFPSEVKDLNVPVGTGPYVFDTIKGDDTVLQRFNAYWGDTPVYEKVILRAIASRRDRERQFEEGEIDILANVPPTTACSVNNYSDFEGCNNINTDGWEINSIPSLEVSFIMFNFENELLADKNVRKAIAMALNKNDLVDFAFGYAKPSSQFISSGVFGFNPNIKVTDFNVSEAKRLIRDKQSGSFERLTVNFDYPAGLDAIAKYVEAQLEEIGIDVQSNALSAVEFSEALKKANSDMYFLGWKSELGDALDFLEGVAHSRDADLGFGSFNAINYENAEVDSLINEIVENLDEEKRLEQMQTVMQIITENDIIGVPLFESETIFAIKKGFELNVRIDGYIHAKDVK